MRLREAMALRELMVRREHRRSAVIVEQAQPRRERMGRLVR
jgi:hypothetical protein